MKNEFFKIITSIPWFVWPLFGYVILRGVKALQTHIVSIKKIFIFPLVFLGLGINGLIQPNLPVACIVIWLGLFAIAAIVIWHRMKALKVVCDRQKGLIEIPGTWTTLILLLSIFLSRFTIGFLSATNPELRGLFFFNLISLSICGSVCGISFGRFISLLMKFFKSSHVDLRESD